MTSADRPERTVDAVLLDIDGTLVDSNYLHIDAWSRAFEDVGHPVSAWRIHRALGMDSTKLLDRLLGPHAETLGKKAKRRHAKHYRRDRDRLRPFNGARELLHALSDRGFTVVLATSAPQQEFDALIDVLQPGEAVRTVTTGEDVSTAKPAPDVIRVALERAQVDPSRAVMVGDAVWDAQSAGEAGVSAIGVLSGGITATELEDAGDIAVYTDVAELLACIEESPLYVL